MRTVETGILSAVLTAGAVAADARDRIRIVGWSTVFPFMAPRAAIAAVLPSIRDAAIGSGASRPQTSLHHVLPLALPGILPGTIIGMAPALGNTAPSFMIGLVAFVVVFPGGKTESAATLPVQVFRWSDLLEWAFEARTPTAICVFLVLPRAHEFLGRIPA